MYRALWDRRHSGGTRTMRLVHWLILVAPSYLRSHNARYIMLKSLSCTFLLGKLNKIKHSDQLQNLLIKKPFPSFLDALYNSQCTFCHWHHGRKSNTNQWPPCQQSDMTLVEVSQCAYNQWCVRDVWLFVHLWNLCKADMVLVFC